MDSRYCGLLIVILAILLMPIVVAQPIYEQGTNVTLSIPCTIAGAICGANATCVGTVINPDGDLLYNDEPMTKNNAVFELNLTSDDTETNGEYEFSISCTQGGRSRSKTLPFFVTPNGEQSTIAKGILYLGFIIVFLTFMVLSIYGANNSDHITMKTGLYLLAYLLLVGVNFIAWNLSLDYLTSAPFIASFFRIAWLFLMYALFPVILILTFYTLWMMRKIDVIQNMIDRGIPVDEAYERTVKTGFRRRDW